MQMMTRLERALSQQEGPGGEDMQAWDSGTMRARLAGERGLIGFRLERSSASGELQPCRKYLSTYQYQLHDCEYCDWGWFTACQ